MTLMQNRFVALCAVLAASQLSPISRGALFALDTFSYPAGTGLLGQNGGFGFSGPWSEGGFNASIQSNFEVAGGSLNHPGTSSSGNRVVTDATGAISGLTRNFSSPLGVSGSTVYLSYLVQPRNILHEGAFNGFFGLLFERAGEPEVFFGKPGADAINNYVLEDRGGAAQVPSGQAVVAGETMLLVVKAQFSDLADTFTLYLNPGQNEPASGTVKIVPEAGSIEGLTLYSTGAFAVDEIRAGGTYADVLAVVPEPQASAALAGGLLLAAGLTRRFLQNSSKT